MTRARSRAAVNESPKRDRVSIQAVRNSKTKAETRMVTLRTNKIKNLKSARPALCKESKRIFLIT